MKQDRKFSEMNFSSMEHLPAPELKSVVSLVGIASQLAFVQMQNQI